MSCSQVLSHWREVQDTVAISGTHISLGGGAVEEEGEGGRGEEGREGG